MVFPLLSLPGITGVCSALVAFYMSARGLHAHAANTLALLHTETAPQPDFEGESVFGVTKESFLI